MQVLTSHAEDEAEEDDGDEPTNSMVDALFDEVEELQMRVRMALSCLVTTANPGTSPSSSSKQK